MYLVLYFSTYRIIWTLKLNTINNFFIDWIQTADLWCWNQPLSKLSHSESVHPFLKKWPILGLFFVYFRLFKQTLQFLINVKNVQSSMRCKDSNSRPLVHESPHVTTRPERPILINSVDFYSSHSGTFGL